MARLLCELCQFPQGFPKALVDITQGLPRQWPQGLPQGLTHIPGTPQGFAQVPPSPHCFPQFPPVPKAVDGAWPQHSPELNPRTLCTSSKKSPKLPISRKVCRGNRQSVTLGFGQDPLETLLRISPRSPQGTCRHPIRSAKAIARACPRELGRTLQELCEFSQGLPKELVDISQGLPRPSPRHAPGIPPSCSRNYANVPKDSPRNLSIAHQVCQGNRQGML